MSSAPTPAPNGPPPDFRVNGYELLHKIGQGGMGVVHLARRPGERRVALKVLRPDVIGDDEGRARLDQEVSSLRRIRSARIAEIVDADPWGEIPYVATRYVPGWSLQQVVTEEGPLPAEDLDHFAAELVEAMAVVHSVGVVHRDIKPSNVLLEGRNPVLIDFGLARVADDVRLTRAGSLLGTPGYLAPEILYGFEATPASDVHSWAATVAYAATGRAPFGSGPEMAVLDRVRRGEHDLTGVPEPLAGLLDRALAPRPADRPTVRQLREWFSGGPVTALFQVRPVDEPAHEPAAVEPELTMPMTVQPAPPGGRPNDRVEAGVQPTGPTLAAADPGTAVLEPEGPTAQFGQDQVDHDHFDQDHFDQDHFDHDPTFADGTWQGPQEEPRPTTAQRLQGGAVTVGLVLVLAGLFTLAPVLVLVVTAIVVWLVRAVSTGRSAFRARRETRGVKWYDATVAVLASPFTLLRAMPRALLLVAWAAGLAGGVLLFCYAFAPPPATSLALAGLTFAGALWLGPGTDRWAPPVARATARLRESPMNAVGTLAICVLTAGGLLALAQVDVTWWPLGGAPLGFLE